MSDREDITISFAPPAGELDPRDTVLSRAARLDSDLELLASVRGEPLSCAIDSPAHYTWHPLGHELSDIAGHFTFCLGNVLKYVWRAGRKAPDAIEDLKKARWYLDREIARLESGK